MIWPLDTVCVGVIMQMLLRVAVISGKQASELQLSLAEWELEIVG